MLCTFALILDTSANLPKLIIAETAASARQITYKSIQVDDSGFPYLIDNPVFLKALEAYIKKEVFTILFDMGKIQPQVLQHAEQQYAWLAGQLQAEFSIPSVAEMERLKNIWCSLIQRNNEFSKGFKTLGAVENFKVH